MEYRPDDVISIINEQAGGYNIESIRDKSKGAEECFQNIRSSILSIISVNFHLSKDEYLKELSNKIKEIKSFSANDLVELSEPKRVISRDSRATYGGIKTPPHLMVQFDVLSIITPFESCKKLSDHISSFIDHIDNLKHAPIRKHQKGEKIFIGHGQSNCWRELKDFISDRLNLPFEEFNRISSAGATTVERLLQMLDQSSFAFLVMTSEDEQGDGNFNPRMNVVHESGLFQGRLGFEHAIILLEEGCQDFSNIHGLGRIHFKKGEISTSFEEVRRVLEKEKIISA